MSRMSPCTSSTRGSRNAAFTLRGRAANEIVEDDDLRGVVIAQQQVDGRRPDQAAAAGDQYFRATDFHDPFVALKA